MHWISLLSLSIAQTATADPQAVLDAALARIAKAQTAVGTVVFPKPPNGGEPLRMSFEFAKPNRFVTVLGTREMRCDGVSQFVLDAKTKEYDEYPVVPATMPRFAWGFDPFFGLPTGTYSMDHPAMATFGGKPTVLAEFHSAALRTTVKVAFDPQTNLPAGFVLGEGEAAREYVYQEVRLDVSIPKKEFAWHPSGKWQKKVPMSEHMLAVGSKAPDFAISTPGGGKTSLHQALAGKKGLLLNFWFVGCNPCRQEFPHLQAMFPGLKDQGFAYLSVNQGDPSETVTKFIAENAYTFPIGLNGAKESDVVTRYGVAAFPTNYVIAPDRTVVARFVGFDEEGLKAAIRKLGLKLP